MSQPFTDALGWVPKSRALAATLSRAHDFARAHSHREVALEHLLLALIEDPDAAGVLTASALDLEAVSSDVAAHLATLPVEDGAAPAAEDTLLRILEYAVAAAQQSRRRDVNGGIVLAAIVGEGKSEAATILRHHGMTFAAAIEAIKGGARTPAPVQSAPRALPETDPEPDALSDAATTTTEEILARARRRVEELQTPAPAVRPHEPKPPAPVEQRQPEPKPEPNSERLPAGTDALEPRAAAEPEAEPVVHAPPLPPPEPPLPIPSWIPPSPPPAPPSSARAPARSPPPMPPLAPPLVPERIADLSANSTSLPPAVPVTHGKGNTLAQDLPWSELAASIDTAQQPAIAKRGAGAERDALSVAVEQASAGRPKRSRRSPARPNAPPAAAINMARLAGSLPVRLREGRPVDIELRVPWRELTASLGSGGMVATAASLRLRVVSGPAVIESTSFETLWIDAAPDLSFGEDLIWRWRLEPQRSGTVRLQLTGSLRSLDGDGVFGETALQGQAVQARVSRSLARMARKLVVWCAVVGASVALDDYAEPAFDAALAFVTRLLGPQ